MMYLLGAKLDLITNKNHSTTYSIMLAQSPSLRLQSIRFQVVYQSGAKNIADPLSRIVARLNDVPLIATVGGDSFVESVAKESLPIALSWGDVVAKSKQCNEIQQLVNAIQDNDFSSCSIGYKAASGELSEVQNVVLRNNRIVVPVCLRNHVIQLAHEGHQGIVKTKQRLRSKVWWPGIDKQAESHCRQCIDCMSVAKPDPPQPVSMTKFPDKPWSFLSADLMGPLPNGQSIIVLVDYYSRYFECAFLTSTKSEKIVEFLDTIFARYGYCDAPPVT